jgi:hypothetical protein
MKEKYKKIVRENKYSIMLFSVKFMFLLLLLRGTSTMEFSLYSQEWRNYCTGKLSLNSGFTLELNNCEEAVIATIIDCEALFWEYLTRISSANIIPLHYIGTSYYEHLILMRHMTCYIMQMVVCEQQASQTFSSSCWY